MKDNHKQIDCVWNDTNLLDESIYAYHVLYQNGKKKDTYWKFRFPLSASCTITVSNAPILKGNTTIEFKTLILKDSEGLSIIFFRLIACRMQRKASPPAFLCFEGLDVIYLV